MYEFNILRILCVKSCSCELGIGDFGGWRGREIVSLGRNENFMRKILERWRGKGVIIGVVGMVYFLYS